MELLEYLEELIGAPGLLEDILQGREHSRRRSPYITTIGPESMDLCMEDVTIRLEFSCVKRVLLTWCASFPVFHQRFPATRAKQLAAIFYRYGLGVEGGAKLNVKATAAMRDLLAAV